MRHQRESSTWVFYISLIAVLAFLPGAANKDHGDKGRRGAMRFRGLDVNNDGRITRDEWRGSDHSFSVHDRDGDGVLSGAEIGAALKARGHDDFLDIDRNRDGGISRDEWRGDRTDFDRMDDNRDGSLTRDEYPNAGLEARDALFKRFDPNGDGVISRTEWKGDQQSFARLDTNTDGQLMRGEFIKRYDDLEQSFKDMDRDHNGRLSRLEWRGEQEKFGYLDDNHDDQVGFAEFIGMN